MSEPVVSRKTIAGLAEQDVLEWLARRGPRRCRYPDGSAAAFEYEASFARYLDAHTAPEGAEGSA